MTTTPPRTTRARSPIVQAAAELDKLRFTRGILAGKLAEVDSDIRMLAQRIAKLVGEPLSEPGNGGD